MDWNKAFQVIWNAALQFGAAYLSGRYGLGMSNAQALGSAGAAIVTGQAALHQTAPKDKQ